VKVSKKEIYSQVSALPEIKFEDQQLTSFAGLVIFQALLMKLRLKERLRSCFAHVREARIFSYPTILLLLIVHLLMGYRRLRDMDYYHDDPMVKRLLGLKKLPDVATVSRILAEASAESIERIRHLCRTLVVERIQALQPLRITLDFDGSAYASKARGVEGTAVGYNPKQKGSRGYYPLFCTVAQTGQVFDVLHRPGNVHDSRGALDFMKACIAAFREALPWLTIEVRMDAAFFDDAIVDWLDLHGIVFTLSVPFERFAELKAEIEKRLRWRRYDATWAYFETAWKPKCWTRRFRFIFIRQTVKEAAKGPVQLDLFIPQAWGYAFTVIVTNKNTSPKNVLHFHHGRGAQESLFGELKSQSQMDYIAVRRLHGNQMYLMAAILAHNLNRELQMSSLPPHRHTTEKRPALWEFRDLATLRHHLIQRAGRLTCPQGKLTLTMSANESVKSDLLFFLSALQRAA
jgi:hypothetical protein